MSKELPQGIAEPDPRSPAFPATLARFLVLGGVLALALMGVLGGAPSRSVTTDSPRATLTVEAPPRLRNGNFFETRILVTAKAPIADATIAVPVGLWREATINSMVPAPSEEEQKDGEFRFHFGPMDAGETLKFKIDGQLNPPLFGVSRGAIRLLDDDAPLAAQPTRLEVLP